MTLDADKLPADPDGLRALLLAERTRHAEEVARIVSERDRLRAIIQALQRHRFGRRSERLDPDQLALALEEVEQSIAVAEAEEDQAASKPANKRPPARRKTNRGALPAHLPRIEKVIDIADRTCPCCAGTLHRIGEDVAERLDVIPAQFRVLVIRRPKYACRTCVGTVVQAPAPPRLVEGGLPTEALVAHVVVGKYANHLPLYRQAQIYARQGIELDRSTLADWVGRGAWWLRPLHARLLDQLRASPKLFADETTAPVLDPGRGRTKTGQLWAYARDDRPWGGPAPPAVAYVYAPDRRAERPTAHLQDFQGVLQVDGYAGYRALAETGQVRLAFCWSHVRRRFYEIAAAGHAPIASEALARIADLYAIEAEIRGRDADARRAVRSERAKPLINGMKTWLEAQLALVSQKSTIAQAIRYALSRWPGLTRFLDDGRIEIDSNIVERAIRPLALNRKNALFAGSDGGAEHWAILASLIETCKLNAVDPQAYLADIFARLVAGHSVKRLDELLPWYWAQSHQTQRAA
ncbi:MAG: IS66 family transposase [Alphaproteobacteria bacterium]